MGSFDDLIPKQGGSFADLIPEQQTQPVQSEQISQQEVSPQIQQLSAVLGERIGRADQIFKQSLAQGLPEREAIRLAIEGQLPIEEQRTIVKGLPSASLTLGSGVLAEPAAGIAGLATSLIPGLEEGSGAGVVEGVRKRLTVPAFGESGRASLKAIGETLDPSLGSIARGAKKAGEFTQDVTGSPLAATTVETVIQAIPELIPTLAAVKTTQIAARTAKEAAKTTGNSIIEASRSIKLKSDQILAGETPTKVYLRERIQANDPSVEFLGKQVEGRKITDSPLIAPARKQGFEDRALRSAETANPATRTAMKKMIRTLKRRRVDADFAARSRVTDVVGENVFKRYEALGKLKVKAGAAVGKAAEGLKRKAFDFEGPTTELFRELRDVGITIKKSPDGKFKADLSNVDASQISGTRAAIDSIINRMNKIREVDAFQAHKMKKLVDSAVDFGKLPSADSKLAQGVEAVLKRYRASINDKLAIEFPKYGKANQAFSEVVAPLSDMDRVFKTMLNSASKEALEAGIGTRAARTLMSNNAGRAAMLDLLKTTDEILVKNKRGFNDDLIKQSVLVDELERVFGSEASTSLGGSSQRATNSAIRAAFGADILPEIAIKGLDKLRNINHDQAVKAIENIINSSP